MIKPVKPKKPIKPKLKAPTRNIIERFYLYYVTKYTKVADKYVANSQYIFYKDDEIPAGAYDDEIENEDTGDYCKAENIGLAELLVILKAKNIDVKDVTIENERYYRKSDGQIILSISKSLTDEAYEALVQKNKKLLDEYNSNKKLYPDRLQEYKGKKKLWDIYQAELKLKELKQS